jgi:hypothetical protein
LSGISIPVHHEKEEFVGKKYASRLLPGISIPGP